MHMRFRVVIILLLSLTIYGCGGGSNNESGNTPDDDVSDTDTADTNTKADNERPTVSGAISQSNTSILISYNEPMGESASVTGNYVIVLENVQAEAGGLSISSATLSDDKTSVILQTASQGALTYRVSVVNIKDLAGNVIAQKKAGVGNAVDPASAVFAGSPPALVDVTLSGKSWEDTNANGIADAGDVFGWIDQNNNGIVDVGDGYSDQQGNTIRLIDNDKDNIIDNWIDVDGNNIITVDDVISGLLDTDLDGLQDSLESVGWTVIIEQQDGTSTSSQVTSDPLVADTDGDGLTDFEEFTNNADPRNTDTDGDEISDFLEWNVVFSSMTDKDSDNDGLPDLEEYKFYFTSPILADSDGDKISDADELQKNRNPRIADRPKFSIDVKNVDLVLNETYTVTEGTEKGTTKDSTSSVSLAKDKSISTTNTDSTVSESAGFAELQVEGGVDYTQTDDAVALVGKPTAPPWKLIGTASVGGSWSDSRTWQTDTTSAKSSSETYENSLTKGETLLDTTAYTRDVQSATIKLNVDVLNTGNFTLTFSDIQISVLKKVGSELLPVATLSLPENFGDLVISPLNNDDKGKNIIFEVDEAPSVVEGLMKNVPGLVFKVVNYSLVDNDGQNFAATDQDVFNLTAGIVIDYGDNANAERFLVSVAGSNDVDGYVGGGWQGGINAEGQARGISLDYAMQDILGMTRHYRYDTIVAGPNGLLDTSLDTATDDLLDGDRILPGENGWIDTQPIGDDVIKTDIIDHLGNPSVIEQGVIAGPDRRSDSDAIGDDVQEVKSSTEGIPYGTVVISAGENKILDSVVHDNDLLEYIKGYETSRSCLGNESTVGRICTLNSDCDTTLETNGLCAGPERISRIDTLRSGDFNRDWYVFISDDIPTAADFNKVIIKPGQIFRLAFLQDLDNDGLFARTEILNGSTDSAINKLDNRLFGKNFNFKSALAAGPGNDVFPDSRDSDYDGLSDFAEIKVGWKINDADGSLIQVFPHPGLADSDGDGLLDIEEMDLRIFCETDGSEERIDALCAFQNKDAVLQKDAKAIIAGKDGIADSIVADDDVLFRPAGATDLLYGQAIILPGPNGKIDSSLAGDDEFTSGSSLVPATHPRLKDTDNDNVSDFEELNGFLAGAAIIDGGNGLAESDILGDDIALVIKGTAMRENGVIITAGPNGLLDVESSGGLSFGDGDDIIRSTPFYYTGVGIITQVVDCGPNNILETIPLGSDIKRKDLGQSCFYSDPLISPLAQNTGIWSQTAINTQANLTASSPITSSLGGDDKIRNGVIVKTDPLRNDTDGDAIKDGNEAFFGGNPTIKDSPDFKDSDNDGLTDYIEQEKGWNIIVNGIQRNVTSEPLLADTDSDGLPDIVERDIGSDPRSDDTDNDGLSDYEEFNNFSKYENYSAIFTNFELIDDGLIHHGTSASKSDTDGDGLTDFNETKGWTILINGTAEIVTSEPTIVDTDGDGLSDFQEITGWSISVIGEASYQVQSNPREKDSDLDRLFDGDEKNGGTDPSNANTDGDPLNIDDWTELKLGTNPLDTDDRCVNYGFRSVKLVNGVTSADNDGYIQSVLIVNALTINDAEKFSGSDAIHIIASLSMIKSGTKSYPESIRKTTILNFTDKVSLSSAIDFKDYGLASWLGRRTSTIITKVSDAESETTLTFENEHDYKVGQVHVLVKSFVGIITDPAVASCK